MSDESSVIKFYSDLPSRVKRQTWIFLVNGRYILRLLTIYLTIFVLYFWFSMFITISIGLYILPPKFNLRIDLSRLGPESLKMLLIE
jgi:hypothetical protein